MAAESVLGLPEMRPPLLDDVSHATRRRSRRGRGTICTRCSRETRSRINSRQAAMHTSPIEDDEDEVLEDEQFDEDAEADDEDEDEDEDDEEEEETWQVVASCRVLTS